MSTMPGTCASGRRRCTGTAATAGSALTGCGDATQRDRAVAAPASARNRASAHCITTGTSGIRGATRAAAGDRTACAPAVATAGITATGIAACT
jgi:hypothetical protein